MGALVRAKDWSKTPLGPPQHWPQSLKTAVSTCLNCTFPIVTWWGPDLILIYNDAYLPILGDKHPEALGQKGKECWRELWPVIGPMLGRVLDRGEASPADDLRLMLERSGYPEEGYFSFSYSPIYDETGGVGGIFCPVIETTDKVIGARRLETLRQLAALSRAESVRDACLRAFEVLALNGSDVPFGLLYLLSDDGTMARLVAGAGMAAGTPESPLEITLSADGGWPLAAALERAVIVENPPDRKLPTGAWSQQPNESYLAPVLLPGRQSAAGVIVVGLNPHRKLDQSYRSFLDLLTGQVGSTIADAVAYEAERKRAESLAELDRAKTAFFSNVSHEFRTPLTLMLGPLEDVLNDGKARPGHEQEQLQTVHRNGLRLLKLVNTLLDFARIEAGRIQASYEATNLAEFTTELAGVFRSAIERAGLRLAVDCPPLPELVHVDREMWEKIVLNLLSNALKFTFEGAITVSLGQQGRRVELTVRDTGTGIPERELPHVFERFHRVEGARGRTHEGSGIGLALVRELVRLHGGEVQVASVEGQGTTFSVVIPAGTAHLPADRIMGQRTMASTATGADAFIEEALRWLPNDDGQQETLSLAAASLHERTSLGLGAHSGTSDAAREHVLVVDDNADMRDYLRRLLAGRYEVGTAHDGQAALEAALRRQPDLVLADIMMPRLDGVGLLRKLREDERTRATPVILLSARAGEEAKIEGLAAGADDYLTKPFSARELLARVESHLKLKRLREAGAQTQRLLVDELNHRVKNTLASVQAILRHTLRRSKDPADFAASFGGRIQSMARMHTLLSSAAWKGADLRDVIRDQLVVGPVDDTRLTAEGPAVLLESQMALHVALMLHELGTNAGKYGALSRPEGWIAVSWTAADSCLCLNWMERGGPPVAAPASRGFGTTLIEQSAKSEGGSARMSCAAEGVVWEITLPLRARAPADLPDTSSATKAGPVPSAVAENDREARPLVLSGKRFLVIEDEPLVLLDLVAGLEESGADVAATAGTAKDALEIIESTSLDAALLDANLHGRPVDEIAAALTRHQVPFIFVSGYGRESLPRAFGAVALLAKPFNQKHLIEAAAQLIGRTGRTGSAVGE